MDKRTIEKEAKDVIDRFLKALENAGINDKRYNYNIDREISEREEGIGDVCIGFKESLLGNAPQKDKDFIIVEKGKWKE